MNELFYIQDTRTYVGNDVLWWGMESRGYTTDLSKAQTYTKSEAMSIYESRGTDIPWPKEYIDGKTRPAVDIQYLSWDNALNVPVNHKKRKELSHCHKCGSFMNDEQVYVTGCPKCGTDNRP